MNQSAIRTIGVAGAGTMGSGIAQLCAQRGYEVRLYDIAEDILSAAEDRILRGLHRAEKPEAFSLIRKTLRLEDLSLCDFVIEAASENLKIKQDLFRQLDRAVEPPRVLATNTSSLSVKAIGFATENPDRIVGMHFFNPVPIMRLIEIVRADTTAERVVKAAVELAKGLGKTPILCKDTAGFVANRVVRPFYLRGMRLLEEGAGSPKEIDRAIREQGGFRMGPFELMDLIGLDVNLSISRGIYDSLGQPDRLKPRAVQAELVRRGDLGRKSGKGFYVYRGDAEGEVNFALEDIVKGIGGNPLKPREIFRAVLEGVIEEARHAAREGVASEKDINIALRLGMNWPKGPFEWEGVK